MKQLLQGAALTILVATLSATPAVSQTEKLVAFTAKGTQYMYKDDGTLALKQSFTYAARGDRSHARMATGENPSSGQKTGSCVILSIPEMMQYAVFDQISSYTKTPVKKESLLNTSEELVACRNSLITERATVLGVEAVHLVKSFPLAKRPDGSTFYFDYDDWQAPKLNCYPLKRISTTYKNSVAGAKTVSEVTEFTIGEPDASLFVVPKDYKEVTREELQKAWGVKQPPKSSP